MQRACCYVFCTHSCKLSLRARLTADRVAACMHAQIPGTTTEDELRELFTPYGSIVELALLKKNPGAGERLHPPPSRLHL